MLGLLQRFNTPLILIVCFIGSIAMPRCASAATDLLVHDWLLLQPGTHDASITPLPDGTMEIAIAKPSDPFYKLQISQPVDIAVDHGFRLSFRARSATHNPIQVVVEHAVDPYVSAATVEAKLGSEWQSFEAQGVAPDYGPNGMNLRFRFGQQIGTIDLADIHLVDLGVDPVLAEAATAIQPAAVAARIDRYRKRTLQLHITDAAGHALPDAKVEVTQVRHAFLFGCNIFGLDVHNTDSAQQAYQQRFAALFNYATLPFYWGSYEKNQGQTAVQHLTEMATWCRDHHIVAKGHPLVYAVSYPSWAPKDAAATIPLLQARVNDLIPRFDGLVNIWDVVNEANSARYHASTGIGAWAIRDGAAQMVGTVLQWARAAAEHRTETFIYNDFDHTSTNLKLLHWLQDHHQLPDVIGMQSHMHDANWRMKDVWAVTQHLADFGLPIHFTETTVVSGEHRRGMKATGPPATDWKTTADGEKAQAEYVVQFYSLLFSHPSVQAITWWDFSDRGAWMGAAAGLLRADMSPKPAYDALMNLIHHDWWTHEQLVSDASGNCECRAFCGEYTVAVTDGAGHRVEKEIDLPASSADAPAQATVEMEGGK